jgi:uncharacterized BrkB/YihY/UPF0761 family membrane protein
MTRSIEPTDIIAPDSAIARAWDITQRVRRQRVRFRAWMLVAATATVCLFLFLGLWVSRWFLLAGLVLAAPGYCLCVLLDQRHLWQWRRRMLGLWYREGLELPRLGQTIEQATDLTIEARQSLLRTLDACQWESHGTALTTADKRHEVAEQLREAIHRSERRAVTATVSFSLMTAFGLLALVFFSLPFLVLAGLAGVCWRALGEREKGVRREE